jgi:hypothetical protein
MSGANRVRSRRSQRRGAILLAALAAVVVTSAVAAVAIGVTLRSRQSRRTERDLVQLELLCDAGMKRAQAQMQRDEAYAGEAWLDMEGLTPGTRMKVAIESKSVFPEGKGEGGKPSSLRQIAVHASLEGRVHMPHSIKRTRSRVISEVKNSEARE